MLSLLLFWLCTLASCIFAFEIRLRSRIDTPPKYLTQNTLIMGYVYVLQCAERKIYVGYTDNLRNRLKEHWKGNGCTWTTVYPPEKVLKVYKSFDKFDEVKITCREMGKYGIENVRGGPFVQMELPNNIDDLFLQFSRHSNDQCFICGKRGHFSKECWYRYSSYQNEEYFLDRSNEISHILQIFTTTSQKRMGSYSSSSSRLICYVCGKSGHKSTECFKAPTCYRCGMRGHIASDCYRI